MPGDWLLDDYSLPGMAFPSLLKPRPLTFLSFWLQEQIHGAVPWAYRLANIAIHSLAVQAAYRALRRLLGADRALIAAVLFAIHPLQAEPVLYIFSRPVLLMGLLLWASLDRWLAGKHSWAFLFYLAALAAKEEAVAFPVFLAALHFSISRNAREWRWIGGMATAAALAIVGLLWASRQPGSGAGAQAGWSMLQYAATQPKAIAVYAKQFLWPEFLGLQWPLEVLPAWGLLLWALAPAALWLGRRRFPKAGPPFWALAGLIFLLPTSSLLPLADLAVARRCYLPVACAGVIVSLLPRRWLGLAILALAAVSANWSHNLFREPAQLWQRSFEQQPANPAVLLQWTKYLPPEEALKRLTSSPFPADEGWQTERGRVLLELGRPAEALQAFGRALALEPNKASAVYNRGVALLALGQREAAEADFRRTLTLDPAHQPALEALVRLSSSP